ncbi:acetyltransferase [Paenibacillus sp. J5C_2022]|uniref:acetyltransferase n=1 Tax=Paenibacillus sp. J5C2022 TaxID=2977129 RepID=UPI0021D23614|nr:acetyltransferase [Paenibacillus sp. J5C2022]MCU6713220.1 acetyltransferase [Paenibacillus sp. J5C2022]
MNRIVAYKEHDFERLVDIWHRAVQATHFFLTEEDIAFYHEIVRENALQAVEIWVETWVETDEHGSPVGFIGLDGNKIEMLFVDPDYHGQGVGTRLIRHAEKLKGSQLKVDVNEQNEGARAFYTACGFRQVGRSELDGSGRPFPLLHLERHVALK